MSGAAGAYAQAETALAEAARRLDAALDAGKHTSSEPAPLTSASTAINGTDLSTLVARAGAAVARLEAAVQAAKVAAEEEDLPQTVREYQAKLRTLGAKVQQERRRLAEAKRAARVASERQHAAERTALLSKSDSNGEESSTRRQMLDQASMLDKSRDVTSSLRRTRETLAREIRRLAETDNVLKDDGKKIQSTYEEYSSYSSAAGRSDAVLKELQHQEWLDKMTIVGGFSFFLLVVIYIVWKRTLGWIVPTSLLTKLWAGANEEDEDAM
ncbi:Hypothetical Protein FCC1311_087882 [Hondaea fermentalgiana]|uniref:Sec20 C-terminal domain-containing protein n=1 Tax=Hondaea fermentalgiana TaxID=2315210 RepID=A0A2R5GX89_9STRA|nr:Hypothetical Protein FCC1311_087882 [Hondaea fermentalgiana]|eukprot:GBG32564.1 Hypothetical Protein FCC1311_087882 [Hondaea fermentalgiana]